MTTLSEHFKKMQLQVELYISPAQYIPFKGECKLNMNAAEEKAAFIDDMIYMLDGPEQREAENTVEADAAIAIAEHAFRAGFMAGHHEGYMREAPTFTDTVVHEAWSAYEPSEEIKELTR